MSSGYEPERPEFDLNAGMALARAYLDDPSNVPCPHCGPDVIEVVCFLSSSGMARGTAIPASPEGAYTVILYCHFCGRSLALDLTRGEAGG